VKRAVGVALLLVFTCAATLVVRAPAAWIGDWLETRSKVRLVDARGTVWHGSALLGMSDGRATTLVPGRIEWRVARDLSVHIAHPWLAAPLHISLGESSIAFAAGAARIPAGVLASAGAPFNTLRPGGTLEVSWTRGELRGAALTGDVQIDWRDATSALSLISPLGTYRVRVSGRGNSSSSLELQTLHGPLQMQGSGRINGLQVRFRGTAAAESGMQSALDGLLGVLGMRSGGKVLLAIDT
jgi:general secretion pathway protein N